MTDTLTVCFRGVMKLILGHKMRTVGNCVLTLASQVWGTGARAPLDFQLINFSGHFRAAQTLTLQGL